LAKKSQKTLKISHLYNNTERLRCESLKNPWLRSYVYHTNTKCNRANIQRNISSKMYRSSTNSPQKFRKMTWLGETGCSHNRHYAAQPQLLSPEKALILYKSRPKGVKPFRTEKHSRLSSVGSYLLTTKSLVNNCGLSHEEVKKAKEFPNMKAISTREDARLGCGPRFKGPDTHFVTTSAANVESCGLSHDEEKRAREQPERKAVSANLDAGLGGSEHRFEGPHTHFVQAQGADMMLGPTVMATPNAPITIPKNNWLKNLWAVAGTALEDREMLECEAIIAPTLPLHTELQAEAVANIGAPSGPRFTYQRPTEAAKLGGYTSHQMQWQSKGGVLMKTEKHSRFSTFGSHYKKN
jgi:hypothetical protein